MRGLQREAATSACSAQPGSGGVADVRPGTRRSFDWLVAIIPALAELVVGGYRIGVPSLWRDEAATIAGSHRPLAAIVAMVPNQDDVHGPYYVLMHAVIAAGGTLVQPLPSPTMITVYRALRQQQLLCPAVASEPY